MICDYRFLRTRHGRTSFARIMLECQRTPAGLQVQVDDNFWRDWEQVDFTPAAWLDVAQQAARWTAQAIIAQWPQSLGCQITIKRLWGTLLDTTDDVVFCATALALCQAFPELSVPVTLEFANGWQLRLGATVLRPTK